MKQAKITVWGSPLGSYIEICFDVEFVPLKEAVIEFIENKIEIEVPEQRRDELGPILISVPKEMHLGGVKQRIELELIKLGIGDIEVECISRAKDVVEEIPCQN